MKSMLALLLLLAVPELGGARSMKAWSYQEMFDKADLVVIAKPLSTKETAETTVLPSISPEIGVVGLDTDFAVRVVMKGHRTDSLVLHHYRRSKPSEVSSNGPNLVHFDPEQHHSFLLFLIEEPDGRYAPVTGQTDPAIYSVLKLEGPAR